MGGWWLNQRATKNRLKDTATAKNIKKNKQKHLTNKIKYDII